MIGRDLAGAQVWIATTPVDMRKSFDGLAEVVRSFLKGDPLSGNLFVFRNRGGHLVKILWWDHDGLAIYYKRLERGEFRWPRSGEMAVEITREGLLRLLSGLDPVAQVGRNQTHTDFKARQPAEWRPPRIVRSGDAGNSS
jgi:transposase